MIYKVYNVSVSKDENETNEDHQIRIWFINKNIHLIDQCLKNDSKLNMNKLIGYSYIHLKIDKYKYTYSNSIMEDYTFLLKNLYI